MPDSLFYSRRFIPAQRKQQRAQSVELEEDSFIREREETYKKRLANVQRVCRQISSNGRTNDTLKWTLNHPIRWNYEYKLAYCSIAKAASSTWENNLIKMANISQTLADNWRRRNSIHKISKRLFQFPDLPDLDESVQLFKSHFSFLFVRHPFHRLVSAYQDKIMNERLDKWRKQIPRMDSHKEQEEESLPTFQEFVEHLVLSNQFRADPHIRPILQTCSLCDLEYDALLKLETRTEDNRYLVVKLDLEGIVDPAENRHVSKGKLTNSQGVTEDLVIKRFSSLTRQNILDLVNIYKEDLHAFDYQFHSYLKLNSDQEKGSQNISNIIKSV